MTPLLEKTIEIAITVGIGILMIVTRYRINYFKSKIDPSVYGILKGIIVNAESSSLPGSSKLAQVKSLAEENEHIPWAGEELTRIINSLVHDMGGGPFNKLK